MHRPRKPIARTAILTPGRSAHSGYWLVMLLTVAFLYGAGEVPDGFFLIKWLMIAVGALGVIAAFNQPLHHWSESAQEFEDLR